LTEYVEIPKEVLDLNTNVMLTAGVMFVDGLGFMITASRKIKFTTSEYVPKQKKTVIVNSLKKVIDIYTQQYLTIKTALMDPKFECLHDDIRGVSLNTMTAIEHVPDIERHIRVLKKRARAIRSTPPFEKIPNRMVVELVNFVVLWLKAFPPSSSVSDTYSPMTIMTGTTLDYKKHYKLTFGAYLETHEEHIQTNTMSERTRGASCLGPTANFQGSYKFLCLRTGRRITRKQFKEVPMPTSITRTLEALAD
jgi:hypothetical protein